MKKSGREKTSKLLFPRWGLNFTNLKENFLRKRQHFVVRDDEEDNKTSEISYESNIQSRKSK